MVQVNLDPNAFCIEWFKVISSFIKQGVFDIYHNATMAVLESVFPFRQHEF